MAGAITEEAGVDTTGLRCVAVLTTFTVSVRVPVHQLSQAQI